MPTNVNITTGSEGESNEPNQWDAVADTGAEAVDAEAAPDTGSEVENEAAEVAADTGSEIETEAAPDTGSEGAETEKKLDPRVESLAIPLARDYAEKNYAKREDGTFEPAWRGVNGEKAYKNKSPEDLIAEGMSEADAKAAVIDIANQPYNEYSEYWKEQNRGGAEFLISLMDEKGADTLSNLDLNDEKTRSEYGDLIHENWISRNEWVKDPNYGDPNLAKPYDELDPVEQQKDIDQLGVLQSWLAEQGTGAETDGAEAAPDTGSEVETEAAPDTGAETADAESVADTGSEVEAEVASETGVEGAFENYFGDDDIKAVYTHDGVYNEAAHREFAEEMAKRIEEAGTGMEAEPGTQTIEEPSTGAEADSMANPESAGPDNATGDEIGTAMDRIESAPDTGSEIETEAAPDTGAEA